MTRSNTNGKVETRVEPKIVNGINYKHSTFKSSYAGHESKISINRSQTGVWTFSSNDANAISSLLIASAPFLSTQSCLKKTTFVVLQRLTPYQLKNNKIVPMAANRYLNKQN